MARQDHGIRGKVAQPLKRLKPWSESQVRLELLNDP